MTPAEARQPQQQAAAANAHSARQPKAAAQQQPANRSHGGSDGRQGVRHAYLAVHGVEKSFGGRTVVKGVTLYVRRGEAVGLLGPNGAGKTTVFYM
ncbi:MAG: ATP-binding cassette domain-containing protein, partial [Deltaproteobacteria bacterium]|nr:ATP-binding cassette domain-containing protein [Deltaproteobacteria bacterium]